MLPMVKQKSLITITATNKTWSDTKIAIKLPSELTDPRRGLITTYAFSL